MFIKRFISAVILLAFAAIALVTGGDFLLAASAVVAIGGTYEILKVDSLHKTPLGAVSYIAAAGYYVMLYLEKQQYFTLWIVFMLILLLTSYVFSYPKYDAKQVGLAFLPLVYVAVLISFVYQTRELPYGNWFVWLIIIGASGSDTFAYLTGMLIGRHHFSELSPKKTIEGCVGGVLGTAVLALVYSFFLPEGVDTLFGVNVHILLLICGAVCSIVSQIGDLAASAIKRNYGIKDYSNLGGAKLAVVSKAAQNALADNAVIADRSAKTTTVYKTAQAAFTALYQDKADAVVIDEFDLRTLDFILDGKKQALSDWTTELSGQLDTVEYAFATAKYDRLKDDINEALLELKDPKYNDKDEFTPIVEQYFGYNASNFSYIPADK